MALPLEDIELIRQLKYRYFRCIDTANIEELRDVFAEDADLCYVGGTYRAEVQGRDNILEFIAAAFHAEAVAFHNGNHPEITVTSATEATGIWYLRDWFLDLRRKISTEGTALYRDRYVKREGRWQIQHSGYERLFEIVTEVRELPHLTAHYLGKHGRRLQDESTQATAGLQWNKG